MPAPPAWALVPACPWPKLVADRGDRVSVEAAAQAAGQARVEMSHCEARLEALQRYVFEVVRP